MFLELTELIAFISATLALLIVPGPAVLYIIARSLNYGTKAGIISTLGIALGGIIHVAGAAFGLSNLLLSSAAAFMTVKYAGAIYLIYLGISKLLEKVSEIENVEIESLSYWKTFWQGFIVQTLNPKAALFFLAFLPQFTSIEKGNVSFQITVLGFIFMGLAFITDSLYALLSGKLKFLFNRTPKSLKLQNRFIGFTYLGLGFTAVFSGNGQK